MRLSTVTLVATLVASGAAFANPVAPADVTFDEGAVGVSLTGAPGDPANGAAIMKDKGQGNCIACHEVTALKDAPFHGEVGPLLDGVGDRYSEAELRGILVNAKMPFEGSVMPAYYKVDGFNRPGNAYTGKAAEGPLDPLLSAAQIEDVIAFLMTLKDE
ncbi:sulfur oxidation c-type cytochrome SoxX [Litorivita pollutaquae]|uniref:Sulfur oxidation c-type cytochrome SoxX n=1 Tax=Litorivita pollutaquae TaxID=2200892 RepID=A0A2V4MMC6_9RHOB|nr:sulfur oxidation c-type cytochrome SoxX [Litorivita pollutaquae]OUS22179.1 sulfur oxidation c-type cytochrome SoxX [Rhodobacterales bacterium 59_46_T64]PYC46749.1 sulfur oxidation c-type cytochrome SoxX [Litorivita pollutaquae]